jgi:hypothetical protein
MPARRSRDCVERCRRLILAIKSQFFSLCVNDVRMLKFGWQYECTDCLQVIKTHSMAKLIHPGRDFLVLRRG